MYSLIAYGCVSYNSMAVKEIIEPEGHLRQLPEVPRQQINTAICFYLLYSTSTHNVNIVMRAAQSQQNSRQYAFPAYRLMPTKLERCLSRKFGVVY